MSPLNSTSGLPTSLVPSQESTRRALPLRCRVTLSTLPLASPLLSAAAATFPPSTRSSPARPARPGPAVRSPRPALEQSVSVAHIATLENNINKVKNVQTPLSPSRLSLTERQAAISLTRRASTTPTSGLHLQPSWPPSAPNIFCKRSTDVRPILVGGTTHPALLYHR